MTSCLYWIAFIVLATLSFIGAHGASADELEVLYLTSGEQLSGTSVGFAEGELRWQLPHGEVLTVPLDAVDRIEQPRPIGLPESVEQPRSVSEASAELDADKVETKDPAEDSDSEPLAELPGLVSNVTLEDAYTHALEGVTEWTNRLEFGGRFLDGNSNEDYLNVAAKFEQKQDRRFTQMDFGGQYGESQGDLSANNWFGNVTVDFDEGGQWILFVTGRNEFDEFEKLDYRGTLSSGLGYRFFEEAGKRMVVRVGPAATFEKYRDPRGPNVTQDLFGELEVKWPVLERVAFEHKTTVHPSIEDFNVFRLISNYGFLMRLNEEGNWRLKLGLRHEYTSRPIEDRLPSDFLSTIRLVYERK